MGDTASGVQDILWKEPGYGIHADLDSAYPAFLSSCFVGWVPF